MPSSGNHGVRGVFYSPDISVPIDAGTGKRNLERACALMANVDDVAAYILQQRGSMTTWKLQKLVYYAQAWHLVWDDEQLFDDHIEAWANGPVVKTLYNRHRGSFTVNSWEWGSADRLTLSEKQTIDLVLAGYGGLTGRQLSLLTHAEGPWRDARGPLQPTDRSNAVIPTSSMLEYYEALDADPDTQAVAEIDWSAFD